MRSTIIWSAIHFYHDLGIIFGRIQYSTNKNKGRRTLVPLFIERITRIFCCDMSLCKYMILQGAPRACDLLATVRYILILIPTKVVLCTTYVCKIVRLRAMPDAIPPAVSRFLSVHSIVSGGRSCLCARWTRPSRPYSGIPTVLAPWSIQNQLPLP